MVVLSVAGDGQSQSLLRMFQITGAYCKCLVQLIELELSGMDLTSGDNSEDELVEVD